MHHRVKWAKKEADKEFDTRCNVCTKFGPVLWRMKICDTHNKLAADDQKIVKAGLLKEGQAGDGGTTPNSTEYSKSAIVAQDTTIDDLKKTIAAQGTTIDDLKKTIDAQSTTIDNLTAKNECACNTLA